MGRGHGLAERCPGGRARPRRRWTHRPRAHQRRPRPGRGASGDATSHRVVRRQRGAVVLDHPAPIRTLSPKPSGRSGSWASRRPRARIADSLIDSFAAAGTPEDDCAPGGGVPHGRPPDPHRVARPGPDPGSAPAHRRARCSPYERRSGRSRMGAVAGAGESRPTTRRTRRRRGAGGSQPSVRR